MFESAMSKIFAKKRILIAAGVTAVLIMFVSGNYGLYRLIEIHVQQNTLEAEIVRLQEEQKELSEEKN